MPTCKIPIIHAGVIAETGIREGEGVSSQLCCGHSD